MPNEQDKYKCSICGKPVRYNFLGNSFPHLNLNDEEGCYNMWKERHTVEFKCYSLPIEAHYRYRQHGIKVEEKINS